MPITLVDLEPLKINPKQSIQVAKLPEHVVTAMGWRMPYVYLNGERLRHIQDHGVSDNDVLLLPYAIRDGLLLQEYEKPETLIGCYQHPADESKRFKVAIKILYEGDEIWVSTFHPTKPKQTKALLRRSRILRRHIDYEQAPSGR